MASQHCTDLQHPSALTFSLAPLPPPPSHVPARSGVAHESLRTQLAVDARSLFTSYTHYGSGAYDATFNVRDLRALLGLCEAMGAEVALRFERPGTPLLAEPHFGGEQVGGSACIVEGPLNTHPAGQGATPCVAGPSSAQPAW